MVEAMRVVLVLVVKVMVEKDLRVKVDLPVEMVLQ